ncbi:hypothetical protein GGX14DRAFT_571542 [Mycena pura]|uniref:Uncharacterized protein n=1 Tax=Mycena pura TaxID=153505 RepID=A0AAD6V754_9AGAR|nr:hypothetical protein GGX14DRAFT_571542 [Mycena pura]
MGRKKSILDELKRLMVHLCYNCSQKQANIAHDLNICLSSLEKILGRYLTDVDFIIGLIQRTPDMYLYEIQAEFMEVCGINTLLATIWRALSLRGFTRKQVYLLPWLLAHSGEPSARFVHSGSGTSGSLVVWRFGDSEVQRFGGLQPPPNYPRNLSPSHISPSNLAPESSTSPAS